MTVIYNMSIDRADKPWIGDRRFTELGEMDVLDVQVAKRTLHFISCHPLRENYWS